MNGRAAPRAVREKTSADPSRLATPPETAGTGDFVRDAPTVLSYAALGCFSFWLYAFGPAVTLLRAELGFSYTLIGTYSVVWSAGAALAGAVFAWVAQRLARAVLVWGSALVTVAGAGLFTLGGGVPVTLLGAGVFGLAGTTLLTVIQAILSDRHGSRRDRALTEANIGAGASAVVAPLVLGGLAASVLGWRAAFALPAVVLVLLFLRYRHHPLPAAAELPRRHRSRRPVTGLLAVRGADGGQFGDRVLPRVLRPAAAPRHRPVRRGRQHRANARSQLLVGVVAAASPYLLGSLADRYGLATAFALEPVLIASCLLALWGGLRARHRTARGRRTPSG